MRLKVCVVLVLVFFELSSLCFGAKEEWQDKGADFKQIRTILVRPIVSVPSDNPYLDKEAIRVLLLKNIFGAKKMKVLFITDKEIEEAAVRGLSPDIAGLKESDAGAYQELIDTYRTSRVDGILKINLSYLQGETVLIPGHMKSYTEYTTEIHYSSQYDYNTGGYMSYPEYVQVPHERTYYVSDSYESQSIAQVGFELYRMKDMTKIWSYDELRTSPGASPMAIGGGIFNQGMDRLRKLTGKGSGEPMDQSRYFTIEDIQFLGEAAGTTQSPVVNPMKIGATPSQMDIAPAMRVTLPK